MLSVFFDMKLFLFVLNESKVFLGWVFIVELDGDEDVMCECVDCVWEMFRGVLYLACYIKEGVLKWVDDVLMKDLLLWFVMMNVIIVVVWCLLIEKVLFMDECFFLFIVCVEYRGELEVRAAAF